VQVITLQESDLPELIELAHTTAYERPLNEAALRARTFDEISVRRDLLLGAREDGRLVGFLLSVVRENRGIITLFGVHPDYRRRGIATDLIHTFHERCWAQGLTQVAAEGSGPGYFWPGVELCRSAAISLLMKEDYETDRNARVDMRVDLDSADLDTASAEEALAGQGIAIRRATADDLASTKGLALQFFSRGWLLEVEDVQRFSPTPLYVAVHGDEVIAFAVYDVTGYGCFGPTGTRPDMRRRGIGSVLLKRCAQDLRARGDSIMEICWAGPVNFYTNEIGAQIHRAYWGFRKTLT